MKILLADDHALFRDGLRYVLQQLAAHVEILEAADFQMAMEVAGKHPELDMALLDLRMPGSTGPKSVAYFHRHFPDIPVVVVSAEADSATIEKVMSSGAMGFVCKSAGAQTMLGALNLVLAGGVYVPPEILHHATTEVEREEKCNQQAINRYGLTPRQLEVLRHLCAGMSNKEIASTINLAEGTVKIHVAAVYQALNVNSRVEAVIIAEQLGLCGATHG